MDQQKASNFLDGNSGNGCVLLMIDGQLQEGVPNERSTSGIYHGPSYMDRDDYWAQKTDTEQNSEAQVSHMQNKTRTNHTETDQFSIMQWQVTPDFFTSSQYGLSSIAILPTNPVLYWKAVNAMSPEIWPSVILQDYVGYTRLNEGSFPTQLGA